MAHDKSWQYLGHKSVGLLGGIAFGVLGVQLAAIQNAGAQATGPFFAGFPFMIECAAASVHHAYYLSKVDGDGVAVYATLSGQAGTVTLTGKAERIGGDVSNTCTGKTLERLRSAGQAHYLQP